MNTELIYGYFDKYLDKPIKITPLSYKLEERELNSQIEIKLLINDQEECISGSGVGLVDAGFDAFIGHFSDQHPSLSTISLTDVYFQIDAGKKDALNLRSKTLMKLEFENDRKFKTVFEDKTTSMGLTAVSVLTKAFEFYTNSELLFKRVRFLLEDAEKRSRYDVASEFRYVLTQVVGVTSYQSVS